MATVHCSKCTAERKGFRRELDSWRHKLIHCIGFESILEGIYGPLLLRDLNLFEDCEPEEVIDWSPEENGAQCSFCNLSLDKHNDQAMSPLSSRSDYSPCHAPLLSESSQSAHRFLQAVFHKKDVPQDCDPNIPMIAQELMKKMIRQFAMEYASKCLLHTTSNGVPRKTASPPSETTDAPLDLTMSRAQEEKELQPDGVLDLSNRKSASIPTSKPSVSSINQKGSGCCLSRTIVHAPGEPERQGTKNSALGAVLSSLCLAHQSLVYKILKLAQQQKLLFFKTLKQVETECYCCHCGKHFDNHISHHGAMSDCTPCDCCQHWLIDHCSSMYHPEDSNPTCSTHQFALKDCGHETARDSNSCSTPIFKRETCTIICPKNVHGHSCQSLSSTNIDSVLCTYRPTAPSSPSVLTLCPLSMCCSQHNNQMCSCHLMHSSLTKVKSTKRTEDGSDISVFKREQSPSPLSPIPSDLKKESDESHQALICHTEQQEAELVGEKCQNNTNFKKCSMKRHKCKTTQSSKTKKKSSGILQQGAKKVREKLKTIKPLERGASLATASVAEKQQLQSASKNVQLNAGAHLPEIITTVLHTGSANEHSFAELIDHKNNQEPQAPNTRFRHRQEMLAAEATLADDATNRRQTPIKQELARLDQSYSKQMRTKLKNGKSIFKYPSIQSDNSEVANCKTLKNLDKSPSYKKNVQPAVEQSNSLGNPRKSKRTIVPPHRFSSYVTEPRKMYFVACFSDTIFNQRGQTDETSTPPQMSESHNDSCASQSTKTFSLKAEQSPIHQSDTVRKRRRSPKPEETLADVTTTPFTCGGSHNDTCVEYTSPIKLMFVSPVKDEEGMKYSLKSAAAVYGSQADECFDPCEESSWSGTPEKNKCQGTEHATQLSPVKSSSSPAKPACMSTRLSPNKTSPNKSSLPEKSDSTPKSSNSSPKAGSRRSGESTPTKGAAVDDTLSSPHGCPPLNETTPPKRRPGRPKKLGPQLEKKVKRPIGRPRKEKVIQSTANEKSVKENTAAPDMEENVNKNLKITVLYGRSRRNKRMVSEGFDQLQTEFHDACQAVGLNNNWSMLMNTTKMNSTDLKTAPDELSQEIPLIKPARVCAKSNIKCQSLDEAAPLRKPGRPAKVKISGISVTVTTVSPRQRKIQINKDKTSPVTHNHKKALFQQSVSAKEPKTIANRHSVSKSSDIELEESKVESKIEPNPPAAIRHSERVRKPSIHFLHAVATSSSYSCSSALVRRSKQVLLNKSNCEQKKVESQNLLPTSGEQRLRGQDKGKIRSQGLHQISTVSIDSVYSPKEVKWWSASVQQKTLNQEFARRIRLISDSWVSDTVGTEAGTETAKHCNASTRKSKHSSMVRSLFDCAPNKPRSCSMQQLCSWFMQTTETQSLTIVKKASSRNSYELMHFPRSTNKKTICYSPQAERLRKHLKKFAKSVPKSPYDFKQAHKRINGKHWNSINISALGRRNKMTKRRSKSFSTYQAILYRAKRRFFTRKERKRWMNKKTQHFLNKHVTRSQPLPKSTAKHLPFCGQPLDPAHAAKDYLCSKRVSPETLKECRVFLRKLNSLNNRPAGEEGDSSTGTLDEWSPSLFGKRENWTAVDKAVKTDQIKSPKRACLRDSKSHSLNSVQAQHVEPMRGRSHSVRVVPESIQPPPAKRLRQSRMMGLTGPRWRDFVFGN